MTATLNHLLRFQRNGEEVWFILSPSVFFLKIGTHAMATVSNWAHIQKRCLLVVYVSESEATKWSHFSSNFVLSYGQKGWWWWLLPLKKHILRLVLIILSLPPCCASLKLGCFHDNHVFDGQICVWCPVCCVSFYSLPCTEQGAIWIWHVWISTQYCNTLSKQHKMCTCPVVHSVANHM